VIILQLGSNIRVILFGHELRRLIYSNANI